MSVLPNFICAGAQKAGTTTLHDILIQHPDIFLCEEKELKFFHRDDEWGKGTDYYKNKFSGAEGFKAIGDITPDYMLYKSAPQRILETLGRDVKIIFILRNPVDRAYSQFNFHRAKGVESCSDFSNLTDNYGSLDLDNSKFDTWFSPSYYFERGLYYNQIKRYLDLFPIENMHFVIFEEFIGKNKAKIVSDIIEFIGVAPSSIDYSLHSHNTQIMQSNFFATCLSRLNDVGAAIKNILPVFIRNPLKDIYNKFVFFKPNKLDGNIRKKILNDLYIDDIDKLELLLMRKLDVWKK